MQRQLMFFYHHFGSCLAQKRLHPRPYLFFDGKSKIGLGFGILYNQDPTLQLYFSNCHYIFAPGKILTCHFQSIFTFHFLVCLLVFSSRNAFFPFSIGDPAILLSCYFLHTIFPTHPEGSEHPFLWSCPAELFLFILLTKLCHSFNKHPLML